MGSFILLRDTLAALPALAATLEHAGNRLLTAMRGNFGHVTFKGILATVNEVLDEVWIFLMTEQNPTRSSSHDHVIVNMM